MRKLIVFNNLTLDGYFTDARGDMSWAHGTKPDPKFDAFVRGNAKGKSVMIFGRKTYEMMASFWPTPVAKKMMPVVAKAMNESPKVVFSRKLKTSTWENTRLVKSDPVAEIRKLKREKGPDLVVMGSGTIVSLLAQAGLVDEYQFVTIPVVVGKGRTLFEGMKDRLDLKLTKSRSFPGGNVVNYYVPTKP